MYPMEMPPAPEVLATTDCPACEGVGTLVEIIEVETCSLCDGTGQVEYSPDDDPSAPDYWKDAL